MDELDWLAARFQDHRPPLRDGDFDALVAVLDPDVVRREDTGTGTIVEVRGARNVARSWSVPAQSVSPFPTPTEEPLEVRSSIGHIPSPWRVYGDDRQDPSDVTRRLP